MRRRMFKWTLDVVERQMLQVPVGTQFTSVAVQNEHPVLYGMVPIDEFNLEPAIIRTITTGDAIDIGANTRFIGTAVIKDWFVAHVFEQMQSEPDTTHTRVPQDFAMVARSLAS